MYELVSYKKHAYKEVVVSRNLNQAPVVHQKLPQAIDDSAYRGMKLLLLKSSELLIRAVPFTAMSRNRCTIDYVSWSMTVNSQEY